MEGRLGDGQAVVSSPGAVEERLLGEGQAVVSSLEAVEVQKLRGGADQLGKAALHCDLRVQWQTGAKVTTARLQ